MKNVKPSYANDLHLKTLLPSPPPPPSTAAAEFRPCKHLQYLHLLPSIAKAASYPSDFPPLFKICASLCLLPLGYILHQRAVVLGVTAEPYLATSLLHMYALNGRNSDAHRVFDEMSVRNVVPYSALMSAYCRSANMNMALSIYNRMLNDGIRPNAVTLLGLLVGVSELGLLQCLHALVILFGFQDDLIIMNSLMNVYSLSGRADLARMLFDSMPVKDGISWNSMIAGFSRNGEVKSSIELIRKMRLAGFFPDQQTYGSLLALFTNNTRCSVQLGNLIQALVITSGFESDSHLVTSLVSMYLKFGKLDHAFTLFNRSSEKDVVLWTAMISGLAQNSRADEALFVFNQMMRSTRLIPLNTTLASAVSACAQLGMFRVGASIHGFAVRHQLQLDTAAQNSLVTLYMKCSHMWQGQQLFESMQNRDLVSWNAVVSGYAHTGHLEDAIQVFVRMISVMQTPDSITIASLLQGCASLGALHQGRLIHNFMIRHELNSCLSMETSLVDMYSKCGDIRTAQKCFSRMLEQDVVSWSAIIAGYGSHGMGDVALRMYSNFLSTEMEPNSVMFLSVLSACSHSRLVSEGLAIFNSMKEEFGIEPWIEHCACVVDLLSRAGNAEEAFKFFRRMSRANADVLGIILDACRACGRADLAEEVVKEMMNLKPESAGSYVQLAHSYAAMNWWDGVGNTLTRMRALGLKKTPGWSFVEVNGRKSTFFAADATHPQWDEIVWLLKIMPNQEYHQFETTSPQGFDSLATSTGSKSSEDFPSDLSACGFPRTKRTFLPINLFSL